MKNLVSVAYRWVEDPAYGLFWEATATIHLLPLLSVPVVVYGRGENPNRTIRRAQAEALERIVEHLRDRKNDDDPPLHVLGKIRTFVAASALCTCFDGRRGCHVHGESA